MKETDKVITQQLVEYANSLDHKGINEIRRAISDSMQLIGHNIKSFNNELKMISEMHHAGPLVYGKALIDLQIKYSFVSNVMQWAVDNSKSFESMLKSYDEGLNKLVFSDAVEKVFYRSDEQGNFSVHNVDQGEVQDA